MVVHFFYFISVAKDIRNFTINLQINIPPITKKVI